MSQSFSRHEQFLRIFALLDILSTARHPLDDQAIIAAIKERLGLTRLSARTLHRDCGFLVSCGYPVDHAPISGDRRYGWQLSKTAPAGRRELAEPLTLLELAAFSVARDLLRAFEGTVLWSGIESLRHKLEREVSPALRDQLGKARDAFRVEGLDLQRYAGRPRLISLLFNAINECREIEVETRDGSSAPPAVRRLQPHRLVVRLLAIHLLGFLPHASGDGEPLLLDISQIDKVKLLDASFTPRPIAGG